jgi:hypothetical protein
MASGNIARRRTFHPSRRDKWPLAPCQDPRLSDLSVSGIELSATPALIPWEAPVAVATLREAIESLTAGAVDGSARSGYGSSDEIDLVNHTSGLSASDADEDSFVQPLEAGGPGLDCGRSAEGIGTWVDVFPASEMLETRSSGPLKDPPVSGTMRR